MEEQKKCIRIALADDHVLLRNSLGRLINGMVNCSVIIEAANGRQLISQLNANDLPDLVLLDLNMPVLDGFETAAWLYNKYPSVRILMLTMYESDQALVRLLQSGVRGFLKKDIHPEEFAFAIQSVMQCGFYYSQQVSGKLANLFRIKNGDAMVLETSMLTIAEFNFLKLAASDLTYKEIAIEMNLNPRAVDGLRDNLFVKLEIKSRVGLAMYAIRQGIVAL